MRKASDVWFEENPFEEDAAYTGPGKFTFGSTFPKTKHASWVHDGEFEDEPNAYLRYNKADAKWSKDADDRDPIAFFGKTIWDLKRFGTHAYDSIFGMDVEPTENRMPFTKRPRGVAFRRAAKGLRRGRRNARRAAGPNTWAHMRQCVEKKFHDETRATEVITTAAVGGSVDSILGTVGIPQGTDAKSRIGIRAFLWSASIHGDIKFIPGSDPNASDEVRIMVVLDKQSNGASASIQNVLDLSATADVNAFRLEQNRARYTVLMDRIYTMNPMAMGSTTAPAVEGATVLRRFSFNKRWVNGLKVVYKEGSTGTDSQIVDNNLWIMAFAKNGVNCSIQWDSRVHYTD